MVSIITCRLVLVQGYAIIISEPLWKSNQGFLKRGYPHIIHLKSLNFHSKNPAIGVPRLRNAPNIAAVSGWVKVEIRMDSPRRFGVSPRTRTRNGSSAIQPLGSEDSPFLDHNNPKYGGVHRWGFPKKDGLQGKNLLKWMIFRKPPYTG